MKSQPRRIIALLAATATSAQAVVTITELPEQTSAPLGLESVIEVEATGTGKLTYQWFKNGIPVEGATQPRMTIPPPILYRILPV